MDTALILRQKFDRKELKENEIEQLLHESKLVEKLTKDYEETTFFLIFRLLCLSEIPYIERLKYTQTIMNAISNTIVTEEGFSYTGKVKGMVPCYNALLLEAYVRLGRVDSNEVKNALNWIKQYQVFGRNQQTSWKYDGICKYGGCMKKTPCYIGIGKTVRALITYAEYTNHQDEEVENLIKLGSEYMLTHHMYKRLTTGKPISAHITDIMVPQAYMLSLTDLVYIAGKCGLWSDERTNELKKLLEEKAVTNNEWKIDYIYQNKWYKAFETRRNTSLWASYFINSSLNK